MRTFEFRGQQVPLIRSLDDLDLDGAEIIEEELGFDLNDFARLPKSRMFKTFALVSARAVFPDATMAEVGRLKLGAMATAVAESELASVPEREAVELTGTLDLAPAVADGGEVLSPTSADSEQPPALSA